MGVNIILLFSSGDRIFKEADVGTMASDSGRLDQLDARFCDLIPKLSHEA
jgi:hypothetical protein